MYHIVKAKFAARNPTTPERSLLDSFTCLLDISNTDNFEHVWKVINECDLDFNLAAERLLSRPPPPLHLPPDARHISAGSVAASTVAVASPLLPKCDEKFPFASGLLSPRPSVPLRSPPDAKGSQSGFLSSRDVKLSSPKRQCIDFPSQISSPATAPCHKEDSPSQDFIGLFDVPAADKPIDPEVTRQAKILHTNFLSKVQAENISGLHDMACSEFNLICDAVCGKEKKTHEKGVVCELNRIGVFQNIQQLALSGQLWSFVPISNFEFTMTSSTPTSLLKSSLSPAIYSVELLPQFKKEHEHKASVSGSVYHYVKLNSFGLSLKLEYHPNSSVEPSTFTEMLFPFSCFADQTDDRTITSPSLIFRIKSSSDIRTDSAFGSMYSWMGKPKLPSISQLSLFFVNSRDAQTLLNVISSLRKCRSPHALDIARLSQPVSTASIKNFNFFSDPWHLARALFDEKLLADVQAEAGYLQHLNSPLRTADTKFVLRIKYPPFLMPMMMRAKVRMQLSSWHRERPNVRELFDQLLKCELVSRVFPFLNSGVRKDSRSPHNIFEFPDLYISSMSQEEITVVFYHNSEVGTTIPHALSRYLKSAFRERASGNLVMTFDDHLSDEGKGIVNRRPLPAPQRADSAVPSNSSSSSSEWMNYLALTDADVAPESHLPSFFLQSLLPSQRQSLNFMIDIEKRPCSNHLYRELEIDEGLSATEMTGKFSEPVEHARFFSLCTINGAKFVSSPPKKTGGLFCDPMGSGKTRTCIAMIAATLEASRELTSARSKEACNLILVPPNVLGHWIRELESCFGIQDLEKRGSYIGPNISIAVVHGTLSSQKHKFLEITYDVILTTYQTFNSRCDRGRGNRGQLSCSIPLSYYRIFCDEAHVLRRNIHSLGSATFDSIWFVTGTSVAIFNCVC